MIRYSPRFNLGCVFRSIPFSGWLILLWPVFITVVSRKRDIGTYTDVDASAAAQLAYTFLAAGYLMSRHRMGRPALSLLTSRPLIWILSYFVLCAFSALWSPIPALTVFRATQSLIFLVLVADLVCTIQRPNRVLRFAVAYAAVVTVAYSFGCAYLRGISVFTTLYAIHDTRWPQTAAAAFFLALGFKGRGWSLIKVLLGLMIAASTCTTAYFASLSGLFVYSLLTKKLRVQIASFLLLAGLVAVAMMGPGPAIAKRVLFPNKSEKAIATATGRLQVWPDFIAAIQKEPWLGYGYAYGGHAAGDTMVYTNTQNVFLEAMMSVGIMGGILTLLFFGDCLSQGMRSVPQTFRAGIVASVVAIAVASQADRSITYTLEVFWLVTAVVAGLLGQMTLRGKAAMLLMTSMKTANSHKKEGLWHHGAIRLVNRTL